MINFIQLVFPQLVDPFSQSKLTGKLLDKKYTQKKKLFVGKFAEDIRRLWEHYLTYADVILG